jgi:hypothetical protein
MAKQFFQHFNFRAAAQRTITICNDVIEEYLQSGLKLSLRQLFYQLVSRGIIANEEREYKKLSRILSNARLAGLVDWDAIEDRTRRPVVWQDYESITDAMESMLAHYRLPRHKGQETYVELWVEKDALAGVLRPVASEYHVPLMVNRGYSSSSAMYDAAQRIDRCVEEYGCHDALVLYLGDLDPSGEDMVRDIDERLTQFAQEYIRVKKLALTIEQVHQHNPPPNPTKLKDTRAPGFVKKYGYESWEVDALPPHELHRLIRADFERFLDMGKIGVVKALEITDKAQLRKALATIKK